MLRYGTIDELKVIVKRFHEVGIQVLGDVVLNHRCASFRNQNGVWNIFGGRLNWDDRAVVADDPHFQVYNFSLMLFLFSFINYNINHETCKTELRMESLQSILIVGLTNLIFCRQSICS